MVNLTDLTGKEKAFLESMVSVGEIKKGIDAQKGAAYKDKYGCDPCDACGSSSCADCKGCAASYVSLGQINPFYRFSE